MRTTLKIWLQKPKDQDLPVQQIDGSKTTGQGPEVLPGLHKSNPFEGSGHTCTYNQHPVGRFSQQDSFVTNFVFSLCRIKVFWNTDPEFIADATD